MFFRAYECMHVHMNVCMHAGIFIFRIFTFNHMYACMHVYTNVCMHACIFEFRKYMYRRVRADKLDLEIGNCDTFSEQMC